MSGQVRAFIINTCVSNAQNLVFASQLYRASALFETIRHEAQHSTDYKLSLFDLQTSSYQALQRVLVSLGINILLLSHPAYIIHYPFRAKNFLSVCVRINVQSLMLNKPSITLQGFVLR